MTKQDTIIRSLIKTNSNTWTQETTQNGGNRHITHIDNYTINHVNFSVPLVYYGNHPPELEANCQYRADLKHYNREGYNYYILVNSTEKTGPLYFEKSVDSQSVDNKTVLVRKKIENMEESYIGDLMNVDGIGEKTARILVKDNITTVKAVANMSISDLKQYEGIGGRTAERIKDSAKDIVGIKESYGAFRGKMKNTQKNTQNKYNDNQEIPVEIPVERGEIQVKQSYNNNINNNNNNNNNYNNYNNYNNIDFDLFDTDDITDKIIESVSRGAKNSMDYKVKGRTLRSSQMGKDHAYVFLDTFYHELPTAWKESIREIEREQLEGNLGNTTPGTAAHEYFQVAMEAIASKYQEVQLLSHELPLIADYGDFISKGHYDGLLRVKDTNGQYQLMIMDIKTVGGKWYDICVNNFEKNRQQWYTHLQRVANREVEYNPVKLSNTILDFTILDPYHLCQLHDYMYKMGVKHSIIVYVSKKDYSVYVVYVPYIQAIVDFNMNWGREAIRYRKELKVIPRAIFQNVVPGQYEHIKTGDRVDTGNPQRDLLDYPCRKFDKYGVLKYQCKFIRVCYDKHNLGKYNGGDDNQ